ncbi:hypothetical protein HDU77_007706 [Chytriomyces hyalinus]|nr:hypothetical protein HDU77_007706 [Chytriomyces hyalinus]
MTAIILVASIDLSLLICFVLHIFKHTRTSETAPIERKFLIICYFGIVSNSLCIIAFVAQVAQVMTVIRATRFMISQVTLDAATHLVFTAVLLTLVAMKIVLRRDDRLEAVEMQKILRCSIATESNGKSFLESMSTSDLWLHNQTQQQAPMYYYGCFEDQALDRSLAYNRPYSSAIDCMKFCFQPGPDDPYFLKFHVSPDKLCSCSSRCTLVQKGDNLKQVADAFCSNTCPDNSSLICGGRVNGSSYFSAYSIKEDWKSCSAITMAIPMNRSVLIGSFTALGINTLLFVALLYFTITEAKEMGSPASASLWKKISPFNFQLSVMALSLMGFYVCIVYQAWILGPASVPLIPPNVFFSATFKTFYLLHSWKRGSAVIYSISTWAAKCFRILISLASFVMYAVVIPAIVFAVSLSSSRSGITPLAKESQEWIRTIEAISIVLMASVDLGLLFCFIVHIFKNTRVSETAPIERKFLKICYFGIISNTLCCAAFVTQLVQVVTVISLTRLPVHQVRLDATVHMVFTSVLVTLVVMKVVLRQEDRRELATQQRSLKQALVKYSVTASNETGVVA